MFWQKFKTFFKTLKNKKVLKVLALIAAAIRSWSQKARQIWGSAPQLAPELLRGAAAPAEMQSSAPHVSQTLCSRAGPDWDTMWTHAGANTFNKVLKV